MASAHLILKTTSTTCMTICYAPDGYCIFCIYCFPFIICVVFVSCHLCGIEAAPPADVVLAGGVISFQLCHGGVTCLGVLFPIDA